MAVFLIIFVACFFLSFFNGQPLVIFHRTIDGLLGVVTIVALILIHVWLDVLISLLIGVAIAVLHAASRDRRDAQRIKAKAKAAPRKEMKTGELIRGRTVPTLPQSTVILLSVHSAGYSEMATGFIY